MPLRLGDLNPSALRLGNQVVNRAYLGNQLVYDAAPAYSPAVLFQASEVGFWAPVEFSRLWQDVARTLPVNAFGQSVASWALSTASGLIYATQGTASARPTVQDDSGIPALDFDGIDDFLDIPAIQCGPTWQAFAWAMSRSNAAGSRNILCADEGSGPNRQAQFIRQNGAAIQTVGFRDNQTFVLDAGPNAPLNSRFRASAFLQGSLIDARLNNSSNGASAFTGTPAAVNRTIRIGRLAGGVATNHWNGRIHGLILRFGGALSESQITDADNWISGF